MSVRIQRSCATFVILAWLGICGAIAAQEFSSGDEEEAMALIVKLEGETFIEREAAMTALEKLPASSLPWLGEMLELTGAKDVELRSRLKSILRTLKKRVAEKGLIEGTHVKIDLEAARPEDVLEALEEQVGSAFTNRQDLRGWMNGEKRKFTFEGSFWEAVDALMEEFPQQEAEREALSDSSYRMVRWRSADFKAAAQSGVSNGIVRLRHARMALENNNGKDYLVVTLVPSVEPCYQVEGLELTLKGLALEDGTMLKPETKSKLWQSGSNGSQFSPAGTFTWIFPLEKGVALRGTAGIEAAAKVSVRRLIWSEVGLPQDLNDPVEINGNVELQVLEREEGTLKVQFEGKGSEPAAFDDYQLRQEAYQILDKDGKRLDFQVRSTSSGGGGNSWRNSYGGKIDGEPARLKAHLPSGLQEVELKFDLSDLPMPGSSLVE
ncbi:MAG: hypothetical protein ACI8XO_000475 [Verrucomicrobiales bacterium]|jgi:hypothetical protein